MTNTTCHDGEPVWDGKPPVHFAAEHGPLLKKLKKNVLKIILELLHFIKLHLRDIWIFTNYFWNISHCVHLSPPNRHRCAQMFLGQLSLWAHARRLHSKRRWLFSLTEVFSSSRSSWTTWKSKLLEKSFSLLLFWPLGLCDGFSVLKRKANKRVLCFLFKSVCVNRCSKWLWIQLGECLMQVCVTHIIQPVYFFIILFYDK